MHYCIALAMSKNSFSSLATKASGGRSGSRSSSKARAERDETFVLLLEALVDGVKEKDKKQVAMDALGNYRVALEERGKDQDSGLVHSCKSIWYNIFNL